jgi:hypothetical protein
MARRRQAGDRCIVMATVAAGGTDIGMIERGRIPIGGVVAVLAGRVRGDVSRTFGAQDALAGGDRAIMTGKAGADGQFRVVKSRRWNEDRGVMAALAGVCCLHMFAARPLEFADDRP